MRFNGPLMLIVTPLMFVLVFYIQRACLQLVCGRRRGKTSFAVAQAVNLVSGIMWGALLVACLYSLTGLPSDPLTKSGPGLVGIFLMLVPAIFMTLREDNYIEKKSFAVFALISLVVIDLGLPAALQYKADKAKPSIGLHVTQAIKGSSILADIANDTDQQHPLRRP